MKSSVVLAAGMVAALSLAAPVFAADTTGDAVRKRPTARARVDAPTRSATVPLAPPANDDCTGAFVIPDGPYPVVSDTVDGAEATPQGVDEGLFPCATGPDSGTDFTVWFVFTPSTSGIYRFTTCPAAGGVNNTVFDTVLGVFASTGGSCPAAANLACNDSAGCSTAGDYSTVSTSLDGGQTYFVVVGNWQPGGPIGGAYTSYQILVDRLDAVPNDTCAEAYELTLDRVVTGTTTGAVDDYQSPATTTCFAGIGQTPTTSAGRDIVFTFTAPSAGSYNIRQIPVEQPSPLSSQNTTLYASSSCPGGGGTVTCLAGGGANRGQLPNQPSSTGTVRNRGEEIHCLPLGAGQKIFVFADNAASGNAGGVIGLEVSRCTDEVEPNNTTGTATPYDSLACGNNEGTTSAGPTAHCVLGANAGLPCYIRVGTGAVPNQDCATSPGLCFTDSVCLGGPTPGNACVPTCVGGTNPGTVCTGVAGQCTGGGTCATSGGCGQCVGGPTPGAACTSAAQCGSGGTCNAGLCDRRNNEGDVDFWRVGNLPAGTKVYTAIEASQANDYDFRLRVTSTAGTLGFDDDDGNSMQGDLAPVIAGAVATGGDTFVRVSKTSGLPSQPYRLYTVTTPSVASAQAEVGDGYDKVYDWPGDGLFAPYFNNGANTGFIRGVFSLPGDIDCWQAIANEGDDLVWFGDSNPTRAEGATPGIPQLVIYDAAGAAISNLVFSTGVVRTQGPQTGNAGLDALLPQNTSFFQHWRARYSGAFELCAYPFASVDLPALGPYPKSYAASATVNCQPMRRAGPGTTTTDVSVTVTGASGNVPTSTVFDYVITVRNSAADIAQGVHLIDELPSNLIFLSLVVDDGFGGANTACVSLPTPLTNDASIDCTDISMAPGATTTYTVSVQVENCSAGGVVTDNTASIDTISTDPNPANDSATASFTTEANAGCTLLACDAEGCFDDRCIINDHCSGAVCEAEPPNCDDNSVCTEDSCDPRQGCINDSTTNGCYGDGNPCTDDACDPVNGCVFPPAAPGTPCDDFLACTSNDVCDGFGSCAGFSVCADGNPCTDDFADENNFCACFHVDSFPGQDCSGNNPCTAGFVCDGFGHCSGTGPDAPEEVGMALVDKSGTDAVIVWPSAANADSYDVLRGALSALPVGPGGADETCLGDGLSGNTLTDSAVPISGTGVWYVIRGANACVIGSYGTYGAGMTRFSTTCP